MESVFNGVRKGSGDKVVLSAAYFLGLGFSYGVRSNFLFAPVFFLGVSNLFCTHSRNPSALNPLDSSPSKYLPFLYPIFFSSSILFNHISPNLNFNPVISKSPAENPTIYLTEVTHNPNPSAPPSPTSALMTLVPAAFPPAAPLLPFTSASSIFCTSRLKSRTCSIEILMSLSWPSLMQYDSHLKKSSSGVMSYRRSMDISSSTAMGGRLPNREIMSALSVDICYLRFSWIEFCSFFFLVSALFRGETRLVDAIQLR